MQIEENIKRALIEQAREARKNAYAPYSNYKVGAAALLESGEIFAGCNVENVSYGLCVCGERNAIFQAAAHGRRNEKNELRLLAIAVVTQDIAPPCGMCRQVMGEFTDEAQSTLIILADDKGSEKQYALSELMPYPFGASGLPSDKTGQ